MNVTRLLHWYHEHKRDLPWRRTKDPYKIWVSEIIMQQTRVDQGMPYYSRFISRYPSISDLALADEQSILKLWQGLGYYSRGRNMHAAAKQIQSDFQGRFPDTYAEIRRLKGIGDYTAAAIASIAFELPHPVVDGNVLRFFSRFYGIETAIDAVETKKEIYRLACAVIPVENPGDFNQAIMEFGAMVCTPKNPGCDHCTFHTTCVARINGLTSRIPVKGKKTSQRHRYFHYLVKRSHDGMNISMKKRSESDIWKGLYDFPLIETDNPATFRELIGLSEWKELTKNHPGKGIRRSAAFRHLLTHQVIHARFYEWCTDRSLFADETWFHMEELKNLPLPRLIDHYLQAGAPPLKT